LFSGAIGSRATLERVGQIVRARPPAVVLSSPWLAAELATATPVMLLVEPDAVLAARRALRRAGRAGLPLLGVVAGERVPIGAGRVGAFVIEGLADTDEGEARGFLLGLAPSLKPDGIIVTLDNTKAPLVEARVAGDLLAAGLVDIAQERPREGALVSVARCPATAILAARLAADGTAGA
jgi:hypothetical protein